MAEKDCVLCTTPGGEVIVELGELRVVLVDDALYPGFCRVIHNRHIVEMTDLPIPGRSKMMMSVCKVEQALRDVMAPDKINLASFGNAVPHLHWHVIPRWTNDAHFPQPTWGAQQRPTVAADLEARRARLPALRAAIQQAFAMES
jgi:diadenosine tetraphosphate (Ap4A) HIT family hydrolase